MSRQVRSGAGRRRWTLYAVFGSLLSWAGLFGTVQLPVNAFTKGLFFSLLFLAVTCTMMPPLSYLNTRFSSNLDRRVHRARFMRQSLWTGIGVVVVAWLQMCRVLNATLLLIVVAVFALIEAFLITRESPEDEV